MINVLDNFYKQPESIVSLVKEFPITGCGPIPKTVDFSELDSEAYEELKKQLCEFHRVNPEIIYFDSYFSEQIYNDQDDIFNYNAIHIDGKGGCTVSNYNLVFCGQILLTKNPDPESGVSLYTFKNNTDEYIEQALNYYTIPGEKYRAGLISLDEFKTLREQYNDNFELTCEVKNVYNRMVSWSGGTLHGQRVTKKTPRKLSQYFFAAWK